MVLEVMMKAIMIFLCCKNKVVQNFKMHFPKIVNSESIITNSKIMITQTARYNDDDDDDNNNNKKIYFLNS